MLDRKHEGTCLKTQNMDLNKMFIYYKHLQLLHRNILVLLKIYLSMYLILSYAHGGVVIRPLVLLFTLL